MRAAIATAALAALAMFGCQGPGPASVEGALLAQADGNEPAPDEGALVVLKPDATDVPDDLPDVVRLAADRRLAFGTVRKALDEIEAGGRTVHLLVGQRRKVRSFQLEDELQPQARVISVVGGADGKACISPPKDIAVKPGEAKCVQTGDRKHISRAYVRQLTREAVRGYNLHDVEAHLDPNMSWGDAVALIDGARTCCKDTEMRVALAD